MFRWPLTLTPLSLGSAGSPHDAVLEITPRGAVFTLAALSHSGHGAHLAVVDAYLKGAMRVTRWTGIGDDSRLVASALAAPLVAAHALGIARLSLTDLIVLPPAAAEDADSRRVRSPDSVRFLLHEQTANRWHWIRTAERFEANGCAGAPNPGRGCLWNDLTVWLPDRPAAAAASPPGGGSLPRIEAELSTATETVAPSVGLLAALRTLAQARFARAPGMIRLAAGEAVRSIDEASGPTAPLAIIDLRRERDAARVTTTLPSVTSPGDLALALADAIHRRQPAETTLSWNDLRIRVSLTPDLDGYQTLCLLPPTDTHPASLFDLMRTAAWETIEALIGRPLAERRTEPIALRLVDEDGHATMLDIGASVVVVRNQTVFTAWVGSDGRVMLKLFPAGGMVAQPARS